jgi:hypothetical protein
MREVLQKMHDEDHIAAPFQTFLSGECERHYDRYAAAPGSRKTGGDRLRRRPAALAGR